MDLDAMRVELRKKSSDFARWIEGGHSPSMGPARVPCPKCGGEVLCAYAEMGFIDFYDTYAHVCLNPACPYGETRDFYFPTCYGPDGPRLECPFCPDDPTPPATGAWS